MTLEDDLGVKNLTSAAVTAFLLRECERLKLSSAECYANGLRSLLRFLHVQRLHGSRAGGLRAVRSELARRWYPQGVPPRRHRAAASVL